MARIRCIWILSVAVLVALAYVGCGEEETKIVTPEPAIRVTLVPSSDKIDTGAKVSVEAELETDLAGPFKYDWHATGGTFSDSTADSTGWTAPDEPGLYTLAVVVTDANAGEVGYKTADITVGAYTPTDEPSYRGAVYCALCHGDSEEYTAWHASLHASAFGVLESGNQENSFCLPCHTVGEKGHNADPALNNGGYDETAVPRLQGVQCENCHGPGSEHPQEVPQLPLDLTAQLCGDCHDGEHHPTYTEWTRSAHGGPVLASPAMRAGNSQCLKCHNGLYSKDYLNDPLNYPTQSTPTDSMRIVCIVCHDPHGNDNPGNLRNAVNDVELPGGLHPEIGAGRLCVACHNGRTNEGSIQDQIDAGSSHFGPHHAVQGDMLAGVNAYEGVAPDFHFSTSMHVRIQDGCVNCHNHHVPMQGDQPAFTGHDFEPTTLACEPCHGTIQSFDDIPAKSDYDGNGQIQGVRQEVAGLVSILEQQIIDATLADSIDDRAALEEALAEGEFASAVGDTNVTTADQRAAGYNLFYVDYDASNGVHNAVYSIQLLQQSVLFLNPNGLPNAVILRQPGE